VIVPDFAKSAATLMAIGAHRILMGPASDLGPIDPQFQFPDGSLVAAKDVIAAVDDATKEGPSRP
jgi:ClpP class serine protease